RAPSNRKHQFSYLLPSGEGISVSALLFRMCIPASLQVMCGLKALRQLKRRRATILPQRCSMPNSQIQYRRTLPAKESLSIPVPPFYRKFRGQNVLLRRALLLSAPLLCLRNRVPFCGSFHVLRSIENSFSFPPII